MVAMVLTLFISRSQHLTCLSSPQENKYGCHELTANALTLLMCPVNDNFNLQLPSSQIYYIKTMKWHCCHSNHLNGPITWACCKPTVARINTYTLYPTQMTTDDLSRWDEYCSTVRVQSQYDNITLINFHGARQVGLIIDVLFINWLPLLVSADNCTPGWMLHIYHACEGHKFKFFTILFSNLINIFVFIINDHMD